MTRLRSHAPDRDPRRERPHDLADNGTIKLKYNYKNLIEEVRLKSDNSLVASYKYDAEGRRVEKAVSGGVTERYVRSRAREEEGSHRLGNNPGRGGTYDMSHVVTVFDGSNNWKQNFVFNDEIDGIEMLEQADLLDFDTDGNTTETTRSFYHRNALGSVMEITDANQAIAVSYRYDPYGKVTITRGGTPQTSDPLGQHWTFTGRFLDEESGLYYYRARYYDPSTGRFLERDPLGFLAGANQYETAGSAPASLSDPSGMLPAPTVKGTRGTPLEFGSARSFKFGTTDKKKSGWIRQEWTLAGTLRREDGSVVLVSESVTEYFKLGATFKNLPTTGTDSHYFLYGVEFCAGQLTFTSTLTYGTLVDNEGRTNPYFLGKSSSPIKPPGGEAKVPQGDTVSFAASEGYSQVTYEYSFSWDHCPRNAGAPPRPKLPPVITPGERWIPPSVTPGDGETRTRERGPVKGPIPRW